MCPMAEVVDVADIFDGWGILQDSEFEKALRLMGRVDYCHFAIPCHSFSCARRTDRHGSAPVVRSEERPEGWGHAAAQEGNGIAKSAVPSHNVCLQAGWRWSIENPEESFPPYGQARRAARGGGRRALHRVGPVRVRHPAQ